MIVVRSFDINKPGTKIDKLKGGVAGGSILEGVFELNDQIEIKPGIVERDESGTIVGYIPIKSTIKSIFAEKNELQYAIPGGLIAIGTEIDSMLTRNDRLVGQVIGHPYQLPEVYTEIEIVYELLIRLLGSEESLKVKKLSKGETLMLNIGSQTVPGTVIKVLKSTAGHSVARLSLHLPVCVKMLEKLAISRKVNDSARLIGWGQIRRGVPLAAR
jgi:translation initiation factor 2 subunit 3